MNPELQHIRALLAKGEPLPPASAGWLLECLDRLHEGVDLARAFRLDADSFREQRNAILRIGAAGLEGTTNARAAEIAHLARRCHMRMRVPDWIRQADELATLPESARQVINIIG